MFQRNVLFVSAGCLFGGLFLLQLSAQDVSRTMKTQQLPKAALRASILLQQSGGPAREMPPDEMFYSGERFRLQLRSGREGYLYVVLRDTQGQTQLIYPTSADNPGENWIDARQARAVPERDFFRFDDNTGTERLWVIVSAQRLVDLDRAARDGGELDPASLHRYIKTADAEAEGVSGRTVLPLQIIHLPR